MFWLSDSGSFDIVNFPFLSGGAPNKISGMLLNQRNYQTGGDLIRKMIKRRQFTMKNTMSGSINIIQVWNLE